MHARIIAGCLGIGAVCWLPQLDIVYLFAALCLAIVCACVWIMWRSRLAALCLCCSLGVSWSLAYGLQCLNSQLPPDLELRPLWVTGTVVGLPETGLREGVPFTRFVLNVSGPVCDHERLNCVNSLRQIKLSWTGSPQLVPGQHWHLQVKLKRPHGLKNPGGFDYQTWLVSRGFGALGYVHEGADNRLRGLDRRTRDYRRWQLAIFLDERLGDLAARPIIKALVLADKRELAQDHWRLFERHGIIHLMVISGLHIGLVSGLVFGVIRILVLLTRWRRWSVQLAAVAAGGAALSYCLLAGATLPTQRACIMVMVFMLALLRRRQHSVGHGMCLALLLCLVWDPLAVVSPSFWLSFGAVFVLVAGLSGAVPSRNGLWSALRGQWVVFVGLLPLLVIAFGHFSVTAPLVNLLIVPLFSLLVVPLVLLGLPLSLLSERLADWSWHCSDYLIGLLIDGLETVDRIWPSAALIASPDAPFTVLGLGILGVLLLLVPKGFPLRLAGPLLCIPLLTYQPAKLAEGELNLTVLDVGQGLSIVVETARHTLVYDVGARYEQDDGRYFSLAETVLVPFLRTRGIDAVDSLVLSHGDNDHAGAWPELLAALSIDRIYAGERIPGLSVLPCGTGHAWSWDGVDFTLLPLQGDSAAAGRISSNNRSCVLSIRAGDQHWLLPGDIERDVEWQLVLRERTDLSASLLIAPHHGSRSSSSWAFLKQVRPEHVVFSSGYRNRFGHPNEKIVQRYLLFGAKLHSTSEHGAVTFRLRNGRLLPPSHYRSRLKHYWL